MKRKGSLDYGVIETWRPDWLHYLPKEMEYSSSSEAPEDNDTCYKTLTEKQFSSRVCCANPNQASVRLVRVLSTAAPKASVGRLMPPTISTADRTREYGSRVKEERYLSKKVQLLLDPTLS